MPTIDDIVQSCREQIEDTSFRSVVKWKERNPGGKVVGYFPVYFPAEIVAAAGMLPVGIFGGGNRIAVKRADAHMYSFMCSICKTTTELALNDQLAFMDVFIGHPICDAARHMPSLLERNMPNLLVDLLYYPGSIGTALAVPYLRREYVRIRQFFESVVGHPIEDEALRDSIRQYNEARRLMRQLYALRRQSPWLVSAVESYVLARIGTLLPVQEYVPLLRQVLAQIPERDGRPIDKVRIVYEGAFCEQPPLEFIQALEEACYVVDDDFLLGARFIKEDVVDEGDPLLNLADAYCNASSYCSTQHDPRRPKSDGLLEKCRAAEAQAVILSPAKFCEPGLDDQVHFMKRAEREGLPNLQMEFQERMKDFDAVRVQTETFAEALLFYAE
jgi:benzoyl-CoA reductase subunit C